MKEKDIVDILRNRNIRLKYIEKKVRMLFRELVELENDNSLIRAAALPGMKLNSIGSSGYKKDNFDILQKYKKIKENRNEEIRSQLWKLSEEKEKITRIWISFQSLSYIFFEILYRLYVEEELFTEVEKSLCKSHRKFLELRKSGIDQIIKMYESDLSNMEIIEKIEINRVVEEKKKESKFKQLKLPLDDMH